ncbi:unnamed protein product, partial [Rotaria sp. Silwood2]
MNADTLADALDNLSIPIELLPMVREPLPAPTTQDDNI